jgi:hypothetical protein
MTVPVCRVTNCDHPIAEAHCWWEPCRYGGGPETCPHCTPPVELRCPETHETATANRPCLRLGAHQKHNDGRGTVWWVDA